MSEATDIRDARTPPVLVWDQLKDFDRESLAKWRVEPVRRGKSADDRNITIPMPFGWFVLCYSDELSVGRSGRLNILNVNSWSGVAKMAYREPWMHTALIWAPTWVTAEKSMATTSSAHFMPGAGTAKALRLRSLIQNPSRLK